MADTRPYVRGEAISRVVRIETSAGNGTAFTVEYRGIEWLVTARHLVPEEAAPEVRLMSCVVDVWLRLPFVASLRAGADVAVARLHNPITPPDLHLNPSSDGVFWSQDVYFLGFPFGRASIDELPFVKRGIVSDRRVFDGTHVWLLDGHNNPGFSGGPVVANTKNFATMQVLGVVFGNQTADRPVTIAGQRIENATVPENTGVILATDILHAVELMEAELRT